LQPEARLSSALIIDDPALQQKSSGMHAGRLIVGVLFLSTGLPLCLGSESSPPVSERLIRQPYVQFATPNRMHVVWRTAGPISPEVRFGTSLQSLDQKPSADAIVCRVALGADDAPLPKRWEGLRTAANRKLPKLHSAPVGSFQYEVALTGLKAATRYFYAIHDGDEPLTPVNASYFFVTPPPVGSRGLVRFSVLGDSGTGRLRQKEVFDAMMDHVSKMGRSLDFWLHVGDMAYSTGRDMEFQTRVFEPYDLLMRNTVCWPTMGNHEGGTSKGTTGIGPYYDAYVVPTRGEAGGVASGTEAFYSFDHANIHFICLDSHDLDRKPGGAMARWLKADLEKTKADWLIAFWHHPPYTKGSHDSDRERDLTEMREYIMPILESGGVDVVLTGHSHIYERSMLMDGAYATPTISENFILDDGDGDPTGDGPYRKSAGIRPHQGTLQIVTGHGGTTLGRKGSMPVMKRIFVEHGSVIVDVQADTLTATMVNYRGSVRDVVAIKKAGKVEPRRLALPWQPPEYQRPENETRPPPSPPFDHKVLIAKSAQWHYLAMNSPRGHSWTRSDFDTGEWSMAPAGFGFGEGTYSTRLQPLPSHSPALYLRKEFSIAQADAVTELGLMMDYSDGFIAYVNGREVARANISRSSGRNVQGVKSRADRGTTYVALRNAHQYLTEGTNILAIECHAPAGVADFYIDPVLVLED
jgi:hypothetical protein